MVHYRKGLVFISRRGGWKDFRGGGDGGRISRLWRSKKAGTSKFTANEGVSFEYNRTLEGRLGKFNCDTTKILISFPPPPPPGALINDQSLIEGGVTGWVSVQLMRDLFKTVITVICYFRLAVSNEQRFLYGSMNIWVCSSLTLL